MLNLLKTLLSLGQAKVLLNEVRLKMQNLQSTGSPTFTDDRLVWETFESCRQRRPIRIYRIPNTNWAFRQVSGDKAGSCASVVQPRPLKVHRYCKMATRNDPGDICSSFD